MPAHHTVMRWLDAVGVQNAGGQVFEGRSKGVDGLTAQAICALMLIALYSWRALATHGPVQVKEMTEKAQGNGVVQANGESTPSV